MANMLIKQNKTVTSSLPPVYERKSLNREIRHRNLVRIMEENEKLLHRLSNKSPNYSAKNWA